jgi:hypothetical protein
VQPHEEPVRFLPEWVVLHEPLGVGDRWSVAATSLEECAEALEGLEITLSEPLALFEEPLIVRSLKEVSPIHLDTFAQRDEAAVSVLSLRLGDRLLEDGNIEPEGRIRPPLECPRRYVEETIGIRKGAPDVMEQMAEIRPRLLLGRVGPEEERETLSWLRRLPMEEKIGEQ